MSDPIWMVCAHGDGMGLCHACAEHVNQMQGIVPIVPQGQTGAGILEYLDRVSENQHAKCRAALAVMTSRAEDAYREADELRDKLSVMTQRAEKAERERDEWRRKAGHLEGAASTFRGNADAAEAALSVMTKRAEDAYREADELREKFAAMTERAEKSERERDGAESLVREKDALIVKYEARALAAERERDDALSRDGEDWASLNRLADVATRRAAAAEARVKDLERERNEAARIADVAIQERLKTKARLAEVEAHAAAMRQALEPFAKCDAAIGTSYAAMVGIYRADIDRAIYAITSEAGRAFLDERKSDKARIAELEADLALEVAEHNTSTAQHAMALRKIEELKTALDDAKIDLQMCQATDLDVIDAQRRVAELEKDRDEWKRVAEMNGDVAGNQLAELTALRKVLEEGDKAWRAAFYDVNDLCAAIEEAKKARAT